MENKSKQVLPEGTGTPYLAIFSPTNKPIVDPKTGLPIGIFVSSFFYEYSEEKEDKAEIVIETDNPNLLDIPELQMQRTLKLQWGWLFPNKQKQVGPLRSVIIIDRDSAYGSQGVRVTIKCQDSFSHFAKNTHSKVNYEEKAFQSWVKDNIEGKFMLEVVDYKVKPSMRVINK